MCDVGRILVLMDVHRMDVNRCHDDGKRTMDIEDELCTPLKRRKLLPVPQKVCVCVLLQDPAVCPLSQVRCDIYYIDPKPPITAGVCVQSCCLCCFHLIV